jgi:hypothetical protein
MAIPDLVAGAHEPLLPPGVHPATIAEVQESFVTAFPTSVTRPKVVSDWLAFRQLIESFLTIRHEYLDGSFVTGRLNPRDMDHSIWVDADEFVALPPDRASALKGLWFQRLSGFGCDAHIVPECGPRHPAYPVFVSERDLTEAAWPRYQTVMRQIVPGVEKGYLEVVDES